MLWLMMQQLRSQLVVGLRVIVAEGVAGGGEEPTADGGDSGQIIVNKIMETLKRCLPFNGQEGLSELMKIAVRLEGKIYSAATSQSDYLRKISLKMLTMERPYRPQNPIPNNPIDNSSSGSVIDYEPSKKRKRRNLPEHDRLAAKEAELIVAQEALKASQEELKALTTDVDLLEERHIELREAIVEKWMQSETGKASMDEIMNICYFKGFEHAYRAKAGLGEDYLLKNDQFDVIEALPPVDCFSHDLSLPECFRPRSLSEGDVVPSA